MTSSKALSSKDLQALSEARKTLNEPSLSMRVTDFIDKPVAWMFNQLPANASESIQTGVRAALVKASEAALWSMDSKPQSESWNKLHSFAVTAAGAAGGFFGMAGTLIELPISTTIMLRSVADIARSEGFSLDDPTVKTEILQVFAMGGKPTNDDDSDAAYYALRAGMSEVAKEAGKALSAAAAARSAETAGKIGARFSPEKAGGALAKLIEIVAARFGITISEKVAAQAAPVIGAAAGGTLNALFINHYQDMARAHFTILRLEDAYGQDMVRKAMKALSNRD